MEKTYEIIKATDNMRAIKETNNGIVRYYIEEYKEFFGYKFWLIIETRDQFGVTI